MTCETTYTNERLSIELCGLDYPAYAIKIIKHRGLDLHRAAGDVISKDPLCQSVELEERSEFVKKSRTGLRYQCKCSYHCSLRAGERRAVHCMAVDKRYVTQIHFRRRLTHLNDSLGNFWRRENRKRSQHPIWVLLHSRG